MKLIEIWEEGAILEQLDGCKCNCEFIQNRLYKNGVTVLQG